VYLILDRGVLVSHAVVQGCGSSLSIKMWIVTMFYFY